MLKNICECGCGQETRKTNKYILGHNTTGKNRRAVKVGKLCACGCGKFLDIFSGQVFIFGHKKNIIVNKKLCECKCGKYANLKRRFIDGHENKGRIPWNKKEKLDPELCMCGCSKYAKSGNHFIRGRQRRGAKHTEETLEKMRQIKLGKRHTEKTKEKLRLIIIGTHLSPETVGKIKKSHRILEYVEQQRQRAIRQLENGNFGWHLSRIESYPEKVFRKFLESKGEIKNIDFFQNYPVGKYRLDFVYLKDKRCIEIDGAQHDKPIQKNHDKIRDEWLGAQGWTIIRIPVKDLYGILALWGKSSC